MAPFVLHLTSPLSVSHGLRARIAPRLGRGGYPPGSFGKRKPNMHVPVVRISPVVPELSAARNSAPGLEDAVYRTLIFIHGMRGITMGLE